MRPSAKKYTDLRRFGKVRCRELATRYVCIGAIARVMFVMGHSNLLYNKAAKGWKFTNIKGMLTRLYWVFVRTRDSYSFFATDIPPEPLKEDDKMMNSVDGMLWERTFYILDFVLISS